MNDFPSTSDDETLALIDLRAILDWLATPPAAKAEDELAPLHA
ncbi:MAG: cyclic-di-GMP-binding protein, partial [Pseudomonadota bacterium]|nr:cyclic-di-GMP-binding protein [Pseudomonadota bacterium]